MTACYYLFCPASARADDFQPQLYGPSAWSEHTVHTGADYPLSPFTPKTPQFEQFNELDKHDKRMALAQIAAQLIAQNLNNRLGKAILSVREPLGGNSKSFKCGQKFNFKKYFLTCKVKF